MKPKLNLIVLLLVVSWLTPSNVIAQEKEKESNASHRTRSQAYRVDEK